MSADVTDRDHLTAYRAPLTSTLWAGLYLVAGRRYDAIRLMNCALGAMAVPLVYGVGRLAFGWRAGLLAAPAMAFWPHGLFITRVLGSEPPAMALLLAYVLASLAFGRDRRPGWAIAAGVLLGLSILSRGNSLMLLPCAALWAAVQFRRSRRDQVWAASIPAIALLVVAPWTLRNYRVFGAFVLLSTGGGDVLLGGNNRVVATDPELKGYWVFATNLPEYRDALKAPDDELERDRLEYELAGRWLRENPDKVPGLLWAKFVRSWTPLLSGRSPRLFRLGILLSWGPVLPLFAAAFVPTLVASLRRGTPAWLLHLVVLHFVINTLIFYGAPRFRLAIEGVCFPIAACTALWCWDRLRGPRPAGASIGA
jgi:4-amino-4-deoxy-L-arabinose transferase-like glycosyltransferase